MTGFAIMALKSARVSGLEVRDASFDGARTFLRTMTNMTGVCGYTDGSSMAPTAAGPALTAVGMFCRMFMDHDRNDPVLEKAATLIAATPPLWSTIDEKTGLGKHDYYAWYVGTIALFQYDGPSGSTWKTWNSALVHATCDTQRRRKDGCLDGSWDPDGDAFIAPGGRAAATAINVLSLETYYRYASVFGTTSSK